MRKKRVVLGLCFGWMFLLMGLIKMGGSHSVPSGITYLSLECSALVRCWEICLWIWVWSLSDKL